MTEEQNSPAAQVADVWSRKLDTSDEFSPDVYWLAVPEVYRCYVRAATGGRREDSWVNDCVLHFLAGRTPAERMLSIGCGAGALERHLALLSAFLQCDAWDIAPTAIETARRLAREEGLHNIHYEVCDANSPGFLEGPEARYDAVWFNSSLHHIEALELVCEGVARSLKPDGWLFVHEYVGPSVFALPPRQKQVIRAAFDLIPERFRRNGPGSLAEAPAIPDPVEVAAVDPSEAVRSADIIKVVSHYFDVVEHNPAGGTVLQFLLHGIAGNFRPEDPESMKVLDLLIRIERTLIEVGDIQSDFVLLAARRKPSPAPSLLAPPPVQAEPQPPADDAREELERLRTELRKIESSRAWRAVLAFRAARSRLGSWLGRRS
ncbi:MAG TPA: class I SAM-dependent methyltransferase [Thermoanaerobaculia bacterium]|jgi:SAM-dependent methyltransferase|nr:class I SAM-dependent methyltransferase [Thermoanaerobaculia bacterium]